MSIKHHTTHTYEHDTDHTFPLPFDPESDPEHVYISANGLRAVLAFCVPDTDAGDPFEEFDEGKFFQFNRGRIHDIPRPHIDDFIRLVREHGGRLVTVETSGDGYKAGARLDPWQLGRAYNKHNPAGYNRARGALENADGYYISPGDVTDTARYAAGAIQQYSAWCEGDVYGVCVWVYTRASIADPWEDPDRDAECWGYYGRAYAGEECRAQFNRAVAGP